MTGGGGHVDQAEDDWVRRTAWGLLAQVVPMPEQPSLRPVHSAPTRFPRPGERRTPSTLGGPRTRWSPAGHRARTDRQRRGQSTGRPAVTCQRHRQGAATEVLIAARCTLLSCMV